MNSRHFFYVAAEEEGGQARRQKSPCFAISFSQVPCSDIKLTPISVGCDAVTKLERCFGHHSERKRICGRGTGLAVA